MNFIFFYFFSFVLTYLGFFLGKTTLEEHKEIKKTVLKLLEYLMFLFYIILGILFYKSLKIIIILIVFGYYLFSLKHKENFFLEFHEILVYSLSIIILKSFFETYLYLSLIPISYILLKNSFKNFNSKEEIYKLILLAILFIFFDLII